MSPVARYVQCPHCYHEVMVRPDGGCLACGKPHGEATRNNPDLTMLCIDNVHRLPEVCFLCGKATTRRQRFAWKYRFDPFHFPPWMIPLLRLFSYLPGSQFSQTERLRLPCCPECARAARQVRPLSVRTGLDCRLLVHRRFRECFEALNGKTALEWEADLRTTPQVGTPPPDLPVSIRL